jgi:hypothetical protein
VGTPAASNTSSGNAPAKLAVITLSYCLSVGQPLQLTLSVAPKLSQSASAHAASPWAAQAVEFQFVRRQIWIVLGLVFARNLFDVGAIEQIVGREPR